MANPLKNIGQFLFGGGEQPMTPMMMPQQAPAQAPPPLQNPVGTSATNKPKQTPSFVGAVTPPTGGGGKSLLGQ